MHGFRRDKKDEESGELANPFANLDKTSVLQEARIFNETPVNPRKCAHILTKLLYLINSGETLGTREATDAFFAMTKLFQSKDLVLRRMVYLGIKELSGIAEDVIIVTSSLTKDMNGKEDMYRAAAIRALCMITEPSMLQGLERYLKQAIVDRMPSVSSAALVSSLHLSRGAPEVVKRWVNEAQEAVNSDNMMVQYHALGVLYHIRKTDRLSVTKLVTKLTRSALRSPFAVCMLIRISCKLMEDEGAGTDSAYFDFIESCLRHKSEIVIYEAAHAIVNLRFTTQRELSPAVSVLQLFCSSPKPTLRFAAVRTLSQVAMSHPAAVTACNLDLENLITDSNRSVATLAITTLLKTGAETSVDRLMKQISSFVYEISDEFKVVVVHAIRSLCLKFPRKHGVLLEFLGSLQKEEGAFEYKSAICETIITIIEDNPDAKEIGLHHLCEYLEDCDHQSLAIQILHLLGKEGPKAKNPSRYIRYIYNRVILEAAAIRAAAVSALARFGALCEDLLPNILVLLSRCMMDDDDEVRDRACYFHAVLEQHNKALNLQYILEGLQVSLSGLERALSAYTLSPSEVPFDLRSVPLAATEEEEQDAKRKRQEAAEGVVGITAPAKKEDRAATRQDVFAEKLSALPMCKDIGPLFRSSAPVELTESETEYVVSVIKHVFRNHIVLQFDCTNTLNDQLLENVRVEVEPSEGFNIFGEQPCERLEYNIPGTVYTLVSLPDDLTECTGTFSAVLKFNVRDCDPNTGQPETDDGYEDEYILEDFGLTVADQVSRVSKSNFGVAWDELGETNELQDTFALTTVKTLEEAVKNITDFLGMQPCERSDKVPEGKNSHSLFLAGVFRTGDDALVRARLAVSPHSEGVTMQLCVRSPNPNVAEAIAQSVG